MHESPSGIDRRIYVAASNVLNLMREKDQLCDAVVRVEDGTFRIHRNILSACSPYFHALFTNGMCETGHEEVFIPGVKAEVMRHIIKYAYTRQASITTDNVESLLVAADMFHVLGLLNSCCQFLTSKVDFENAIGIRNFARFHTCTQLGQMVHAFILTNFAELATKSNELLLLSEAELVELLSDDALNVNSEETVFEAALRWINHDAQHRRHCIHDLLKCVRLGRLSSEYFMEKVKAHEFISGNEACRDLVIDTFKILYDLNIDSVNELDLFHEISRPRLPYEVMFVVGGWSGGSPTNEMETYDPRAERWFLTDYADIAATGDALVRAYHGCATVDGKVYVVGGFDGIEYFSSVRRFDPVDRQWAEVAPMNCKRCYVSVTVLDGCIYALGGFDGHMREQRLGSAERYTPSTNQWSVIAPMNIQRSDGSATSLGGNVYIAGGFDGHECLTSAECYNPATDQWTLISPMRNRRSGIGVAALDGHVFAVGGFNGMARMTSGERYNPETNAWTPIADMIKPRSNFAIEVVSGLIFAIGGFNGSRTINDVECYDPQAEEWFPCADMNLNRSALSTCVVKGLPNVRNFLHPEHEEGSNEERLIPDGTEDRAPSIAIDDVD